MLLAAVNGDFFNVATREPIGGVIVNGVVLRSPNLQQNQLTVEPNGQIVAGALQWHAKLSAPDGTTIPLSVNDPNAASAIVYNRNFGAATPVSDAVELTFSQRSAAGLRLDRTLHFRFVGSHRPGQAVPPGQVVVSATGFDGLLLAGVRDKFRAGQIPLTITMTLSTGPEAWNSLGANHILLRSGHVVPINENDDFVYGAHPRTLFGWNNRGKVIFVTIGSSVPGRSAGVSLPVAAEILHGLGVGERGQSRRRRVFDVRESGTNPQPSGRWRPALGREHMGRGTTDATLMSQQTAPRKQHARRKVLLGELNAERTHRILDRADERGG